MRICIVAHNAYGMITGDTSKHIGGVENQTALMARWFAARGHEVSLVTWEENGAQAEYRHGVRIIKTCPSDAGIRFLRFLAPRWTSLLRAMAEADAEIYYQNGAEHVTGQVGIWCRRNNRKFVFSTASDMDCRPDPPYIRRKFERRLYKAGVERAHLVVAQTESQVQSMQEVFGVPSRLLPMPCGLPAESLANTGPGVDERVKNPIILVGRISPEKNVELFIDVASKLPHRSFLVVGPVNPADDYCKAMLERADDVENIRFMGAAARDQLSGIYTSASLLLCTSQYEGFPNTFIESWCFGLPIISTVDPDSSLTRHTIGLVAANRDEFVHSIESLLNSPETYADFSARAKTFFENRHHPDRAMLRFEREFQMLLEN